MRTPIVAANWKMHKTQPEARQFLADFLPREAGMSGVEIVICPPFTALAAVAGGLTGTRVGLGAQNMSDKPSGAFTGEVSGAMLVDAGCRYVILGHSERRRLFGESDEVVGAKVRAALQHGLIPILCIGETLEEQQAGEADAVNRRQLLAGLEGLTPEQVANLVIAYEPVWAIGTGRNCDPGDAQARIAAVRAVVAEAFGPEAAARVRIQYGGSVKPENMAAYMAQPDIDGALVGGASLDPTSFAAICAAAAEARAR
ncbi:triose-phosphate isomerase [Symbiobacterium thermophilum]|uniref:Triosephosphate isomerase n=1 Tax=Symbiobacterium thermophilum (strain DSM 24528 / JCM 14929 / IAM 14863 / T) TaxID=292459 RepID=TPIS_SYMTH|nr:triose-phosphate isomerase [Symbiobacterium thermophilum]Q67SW4.1 RecName: Full=Triosephosphate isomerase; Short=TIM; Short=TPI; AltName: Full=Triose-phosphate isomerase [Symbiobacterium thermophilum IAM 14863]BAD39229.1 triosephosphate isomerase [Symbiobacterium thermophilum IAM 14863]